MGGLSMTREEELYETADNFSEDHKYEEDLDYVSLKMAFIEGAEWADKHPDINSLWHTPDEMPQYNKRIIIHCDEKLEWHPIDNTVHFEDPEYPWSKVVEIFHILHWAYATDLVPNFNEKL